MTWRSWSVRRSMAWVWRSCRRRSRRSSKPCVSSRIDGRVVYWIGALDVGELTALGGTPQHERAATHVATPDELPGQAQAGPQHRFQGLEVLRRRDAAEQDGGIRRVEPFSQSSGIPPQRTGEPQIAWVYRDPGDRPQPVEIDQCIGRPEAQPGYDDVYADRAVRRIAECRRIGQLAPKIQPAHEGEDFADGRSCSRSQALRQCRAAILPQQKPGTLSRAVGGGEKKDLVTGRHWHTQTNIL